MASNSPPKPNAKNILLIKLGAVGDLVIASSFFDNLRKNYPNAKISLLTGKPSLEIVQNNPCIDEFILADDATLYKGNFFSRLRELFRIVLQLRKYSFDLVFVMHRAWQFNILAYLVGIPRRVGFARGNEGIMLTDVVIPNPSRNEREHYLDLLRTINIPAEYQRTFYYFSEDEKKFLPAYLLKQNITEEEPVMALIPGGGENVAQGVMVTRRWPISRYIALVKKFKNDYGGKVIIVGGPGDRELAKDILKAVPDCINATDLKIGHMASLFQRCQVVIGNDCGPLHISTALQRPTISIYGATDSRQWASPDKENKVLHKNISCSPCFNDGNFPVCEHLSCLNYISVEEVYQHVQNILSGSPNPINNEKEEPQANPLPVFGPPLKFYRGAHHRNNVFYSLDNFQLEHFDNLATASQYWPVYDESLRHIKQGATVLDWGCGDGHFSYFLLNNGFKTHSFNANEGDAYNPEGCKLESFLGSEFQDAFQYKISTQGPVHLPYEDETFDAVVSVGVLEHVRQEGGSEAESMKEIHRVLKKGGLFLCYHFPNKYSWIEALARRSPSRHQHPYLFTKKDIYNLNKMAHLQVEKLQGYALLPRNELSRLPKSIKNNLIFVCLYNLADRFLYSLFPLFFQNYYFLSRKSK
jgi:lipopolysaccharide heptosyltransferase II